MKRERKLDSLKMLEDLDSQSNDKRVQKEILDLVDRVNVESTDPERNHLIEKGNDSDKYNQFQFRFLGSKYLVNKEGIYKLNKSSVKNRPIKVEAFEVGELMDKLEVATTFTKPLGVTEAIYLKDVYDPSSNSSFWRQVLDHNKASIEKAKDKEKDAIEKGERMNLANMANNFDESIAHDLTEDEKNYIKSLAGVNKYNMFELKTFETFDFDKDKDSVVDIWLEDNNFYKDMGKWSNDSTFSVIVPDYLIDKNGYLKVDFGKVGGNFEIDGGRLVSLKGTPDKVGGDFEIINNYIESLRFLPNEIKGGLYLYNNKLKSLYGLQDSNIGTYINVSKNDLTTLEGCPAFINGSFKCKNNNLTSLEGGPIEIKGSIDFSNNKLTTLNGAPKKVSGDVKMENIGSVPETEVLFYKEIKSYDHYYSDLLDWIINNDRLERDLDDIDWPENFLKSKGNIIRSVKGINKYNLGLELNDSEELN